MRSSHEVKVEPKITVTIEVTENELIEFRAVAQGSRSVNSVYEDIMTMFKFEMIAACQQLAELDTDG